MGSFDLERQLQDLMRRVHLLEVGNPLGYSSVSEGSLRILSNEGLTVEGSAKVAGWLVVTGTQRLTGTLEGSGTLDWTGPWYLKGTGQITGDCTVTGKMFVNGPWEMNGAGKIKGNVDVTGELDVTGKTRLRGKTTLENDLQILSGGKIKVGDMIIDPSIGGGSVSFANGGMVFSNNTSVGVSVGGASAIVSPTSATLYAGGPSLRVTSNEIAMIGLPSASSTSGLQWVGVDSSGNLRKVDPAVGGPLGGPFDWPFPLSMVTSEFGPRPELGDYHTGMDFGPASGTPIPSAGPGRVVASGWVEGGGGYHIKIDHGIRGGKKLETGYFHMIEAPALQVGAMVAAGTIIGHIGSTGNSTGPHLHWETFIDGVQVNPRSFMATYGKK